MTLCNMVIEAGGKNGVVPADTTTFNYLEVVTLHYHLYPVHIFMFIFLCLLQNLIFLFTCI